ncbi:MAG: hypothetical protein AAFU64_18715 [Bacteroidota bacterium]
MKRFTFLVFLAMVGLGNPVLSAFDHPEMHIPVKDSNRWSHRFIPNRSQLSNTWLPKESRGWVSNKGKGYFKLSQSFIRTDQFYSPAGTKIDIVTNGLYMTSLYAEYGISNRFTLVANIPFFVRSTLNEVQFVSGNEGLPGDELNAFGDMELGIKFGLIRDKPFVLSAGLTLGIPSGNNSGGETQLLQSGDGEFNQLISLNAGYSIARANIYLGASIGFNNRTQDFSEEFRFGFEAGYSPIPTFTALVKIDGIESFQNGEALGATNGIFSNNMEFITVSPELNYTFYKNYGLSANVVIPVRGQRILAAPSYSVGLFWKLQ